ncbi:phosphate ABC transporter permease [Oscillatoria sp. FACHB-1406]|uniref:phosphate ABC transporter permease n=1 Tax=Oscillatoria sp. FACHB-1406 TaxID=2692846 RepID=UPI0016878D14|nr:phosphate ABC transporter permease [Oscillatoria sp. FACHB-1406]MBD2580576.1 phosphate ABC transporter permease [Oscillatoria sp. FACHB-1406]
MLIPLTRAKFEQLVPAIATGAQYIHYWGKLRDFLRRLLISFIAVIILWVVGQVFGSGAGGIKFLMGFVASLYWLWSPVYWASTRNVAYRRYKYSGFWRGRVLDVFVTDDLVREEETVNQRGELVIIENRERRINLEVGDKTGFRTTLQAPLQRVHKAIAPGQIAELLVFSDLADLSRISQTSDVYLPEPNLWVGDYPCLAKDAFVQTSEQLMRSPQEGSRRSSPRSKPSNPRNRRFR